MLREEQMVSRAILCNKSFIFLRFSNMTSDDNSGNISRFEFYNIRRIKFSILINLNSYTFSRNGHINVHLQQCRLTLISV